MYIGARGNKPVKKLLTVILICAAFSFTACADKKVAESSGTSDKQPDPAGQTAEKMSMPDANMPDDEYLLALGRSLEHGMTADEVVSGIGEPDEYVGIYENEPMTAPFLIYWRGEYRLFVRFRGENKTSDYIILFHWESDENLEMVFHEDL